MSAFILPAVLLLVALIVVARSFVVVPARKAYVVEHLGRFDRVLTEGRHFITPFVSRVSVRIPLDEQSLEIPPTSQAMASGSEATAHGSITFYVADPALAITQVADYRAALATLVATEWRRAIGASDALTVIDRVRAAEATIAQTVKPWGLSVVDTQPLLTLAPEAMQGLEAQAAAERDARVLAWLAERRQRPGSDGRPTAEQHAAYREWLDLEVRVHADEIAEARRRESN